jgi:hypothetical protein
MTTQAAPISQFQSSSGSPQSTRPYPGLRPFFAHESRIFFGRDRHVKDILERLDQNFVAVIGPSGCGKSSLLRAGVIAELKAGRMVKAGAQWAVADMRPQNNPHRNLSLALDRIVRHADAPADYARLDELEGLIVAEPGRIPEFLAGHGMSAGANILLLVDQFEELFSAENEKQRDVVLDFITFLLRINRGEIPHVHCIITMRTDHLGDCARYPDLAQAINHSFYLTPNLNDEEIRKAIELPTRLRQYRCEFEPGLVDMIQRDMSREGTDQLPLMQHVMMRMWDAIDKRGIEKRFTHALYEDFGGVNRGINVHAEEIQADLSPAQRVLVPKLFRQLTVRREGATYQDVRRPTMFDEIAQVAGQVTPEARADLRAVIDRFRRSDTLFLQSGSGEANAAPAMIADDQRIDIVHECLIRKWSDLKIWVAEEWKAAKDLKDLVRQAEQVPLDELEVLHSNQPWRQRTWREVKQRADSLGDLALLQRKARSMRTVGLRRLRATGAAVSDWWREAPQSGRKAADSLTALPKRWLNPLDRAADIGQLRQMPGRALNSARTLGGQLQSQLQRAREADETDEGLAESRKGLVLDRAHAEQYRLWRRQEQPNAAWARRYDVDEPSFTRAGRYLAASLDAHREAGRRRLLKWTLGPAAVVGAIFGGLHVKDNLNETRNRESAEINFLSNSLYVASMLNNPDTDAAQYRGWKEFVEAKIKTKALEKHGHYDDWIGQQKSILHMASQLLVTIEEPAKRNLNELVTGTFALPVPSATGEKEASELQPCLTALNSDGTRYAMLIKDAVHVFDSKWDRIGAPLGATSPQLTGCPARGTLPVGERTMFFGADGDTVFVLDRHARTLQKISPAVGTIVTRSLTEGSKSNNSLEEDIEVAADGALIALVSAIDAQLGRWQVAIVNPDDAKVSHIFEINQAGETLTGITYGANARDQIILVFNGVNAGAWNSGKNGPASREPDWRGKLAVAVTRKDKLRLSKDGNWIALAQKADVHLWDTAEFKKRRTKLEAEAIEPTRTYPRPPSDREILDIRLLANGELLTFSNANIIRVWPYRSGGAAKRVLHSPSAPYSTAMSSDGIVVAADREGPKGQEKIVLKRYDLRQPLPGHPVLQTIPHGNIEQSVIHSGGKLVAVGMTDGNIAVYRPDFQLHERGDFKELPVIRPAVDAGVPSPIIFLAVSQDANFVVGVRKDGGILSLTKSAGTSNDGFTAQYFKTGDGTVRSAALAPTGAWLALVLHDGRVTLLQRDASNVPAPWKNTPIRQLNQPDVCVLAFNQKGDQIALGSATGEVFRASLSDFRSGVTPRSFHAFGKSVEARNVLSIAFGSHNDVLMTLSQRILLKKPTCDIDPDPNSKFLVSLVRDVGQFRGNQKSRDLNAYVDAAAMLPGSNSVLLTAAAPGVVFGIQDLDHLKSEIENAHVDSDDPQSQRSQFELKIKRFEYGLDNAIGNRAPDKPRNIYAATMGCDENTCLMVVPTGDPSQFAVFPFERNFTPYESPTPTGARAAPALQR